METINERIAFLISDLGISKTKFAERLNITSSRMVQDYGLKTVDEIIEAEAAQGNTQAVNYAREMYNSPEKLIKIFKLTDVENKFVILHNIYLPFSKFTIFFDLIIDSQQPGIPLHSQSSGSQD